VVVAPAPRRVDVVYSCRLPEGVDPDQLVLDATEVVDARWFDRGGLPDLQHEASGALVALARAASGSVRTA
jgi:hypothetical protein